MNVFENISYEAENLISFRKVMTSAEMRAVIIRMEEYISSRGAKKTGSLITATYAIDNKMKLSDTTVFIPVNMKISSIEFSFVRLFKIDSCFMVKHKGAPGLMPAAYMALKDKMEKTGLEMTPPFYHVYIREAFGVDDLNLFEVDIYVAPGGKEILNLDV